MTLNNSLTTLILLCILTGVFVANKTDLEGRRVVERNKAEEFAKGKGLEYFECSAVSINLNHVSES